MIQKTIGGDRLGAGKKQKVTLHNYERSTHDLSYIWRSSMAPGTLVPFINEIALPGDTFDIKLNANVLTHPTVGPLFGSFKQQLDIFLCPIRLYNSALHNNMLGIGNHMEQVLLPQLQAEAVGTIPYGTDLSTAQINPSALMSYLGTRGWGYTNIGTPLPESVFAGPLIAYWDIYKNYYSNKQEEIGVYIEPTQLPTMTVDYIHINDDALPEYPLTGPPLEIGTGTIITIGFTGTVPSPNQISVFNAEDGRWEGLNTIAEFNQTDPGTLTSIVIGKPGAQLQMWRYINPQDDIQLATFPLSNIDDMRTTILQAAPLAQVTIDASFPRPYGVNGNTIDLPGTMCGLGIKTYQSDLLNNWIQTEWLDGDDGVNKITAIDTSGGSFQVDSLILARKVYDMLNRIAISGGTYDDWLDAVWAHERYTRCESPMYMGGLSKEVVFQTVVSTADASDQPLGTLAGRGSMSNKHKGGDIIIKVDEPSIIIGIVSLTPRLDYSQGNKWSTHLKTMNDLHKPALDQIGFQELLTDQMAWWDKQWNGTEWVTRSAGKQPAWTNYMTNVNQCYGNFAIPNNEMFMTLNRQYIQDPNTLLIADVTTYIDPSKFNFIFAQTNLDAQNFWVQIAVEITARRKMSAKIMPNL